MLLAKVIVLAKVCLLVWKQIRLLIYGAQNETYIED